MSRWQAFWGEVTEPVEAHVLVAHYPSNTSFGSSRMYGNVYQPVTLQPGDLVADLPGGMFARHNGVWYDAAIELDEKHPFEKSYLPKAPPTWPASVREVGKPEGFSRFKVPTTSAEWVYAHGAAVGRSIDYVVAATEAPVQ